MASRERRDLNIELYISTATSPLGYFFLILLGDVTNREVWMGPTRIEAPGGMQYYFVSADDIKISEFVLNDLAK